MNKLKQSSRFCFNSLLYFAGEVIIIISESHHINIVMSIKYNGFKTKCGRKSSNFSIK